MSTLNVNGRISTILRHHDDTSSDKRPKSLLHDQDRCTPQVARGRSDEASPASNREKSRQKCLDNNDPLFPLISLKIDM